MQHNFQMLYEREERRRRMVMEKKCCFRGLPGGSSLIRERSWHVHCGGERRNENMVLMKEEKRLNRMRSSHSQVLKHYLVTGCWIRRAHPV